MRAEREAILKQVRDLLEPSDFMFVTDYTGMKVKDFSALRAELSPLDARVNVVKNTFVRRAIDSLGWEDPGDALTGPTAIVTGARDAAATAKLLMTFLKPHTKSAVKGGCLEGRALTSEDVDALAKLPAREVMLAMFVGTVAAPMSQLVGVMSQKLQSLLYALKAVEEKKRGAA